MNFLFLETVGYESAIRLSGHHYARLLAERGHRALSLSSPVTPFHRLVRKGAEAIRGRFENHRAGFVDPSTGGVGLLHYVPHALIPVRNFFPFNQPWVLRLAAASSRNDILGRLESLGFQPDLISLHNMMFAPLASEFPRAFLWYRMEDLLEGFPDMPRSMIEQEKLVLNRADLVSITSEELAFKVPERDRGKMILAPNGVDLAHFSSPRPRPAAWVGIEKPIVLYIGTFQSRFDWDAFALITKAMPQLHYCLISPETPRNDFLSAPNVSHIPGVPYEETPAYYQHAAVGVIPFVNSPLVQAVSPIKLFEFLAAGTPVVATEWKTLKNLNAPIRLARTPEEFICGIEDAVVESKPRDFTQFLSGHTWQGNLDRILERIERFAWRSGP